jgi:Family of unknown function (DUF6253)
MKIIQITPAEGWTAVFNTSTDTKISERLVCWALTDTGTVHGMVAPKGNIPMVAENVDNFLEYHYLAKA